MNTKFTAAAQAIADHFKQAEAQRGEPFRDTFTNPMNNDAVTPNFVGVPLALLRTLTEYQPSAVRTPYACIWEVVPGTEHSKRKGPNAGVYLEDPASLGIPMDHPSYRWTLVYTNQSDATGPLA